RAKSCEEGLARLPLSGDSGGCRHSSRNETAKSFAVHKSLRRASPICRSCDCRCRLTERPNAHRLVIHDLKNRIQLCNLHHVAHLFCEVEQFQFSLLLPHTCERTDQRTQACTVDVIDIAKIEQYFPMSFAQQLTN